MVVRLLGGERHLGHEREGAVEVLEHELACDRIATFLTLPTCGYREFGDHGVLSTPLRIWSSSMDSNSALKLPSPKPSSPLRWMNSKKIGPSWFSLKICSRSSPGLPSIRILRSRSSATFSPWPGMRLSMSS